MVTASHNPPSDNAVKVYWSTGGQILPPHDRGVIDRVMSVDTIERVPFDEALADGRVTYCQEEVDRVYHQRIAALSTPGARDIKVIYSPMHGVGASVVNALSEWLELMIWRDGKEHWMRFEHGDAVNSLEVKGDAPKDDRNPDENGFKKGTRVTFKASTDTFKNVTEFDFDKLEHR